VGIRRRVELVATVYADELPLRSLAEISAITADQNVRIIGGQMASLLLTAFPVAGIALRRSRSPSGLRLAAGCPRTSGARLGPRRLVVARASIALSGLVRQGGSETRSERRDCGTEFLPAIDAEGERHARQPLLRVHRRIALGHRPVPLTLPGQGDGFASATLDDQVAAVLAAVDSAPEKPMVVGHSAASTLAWLAADARPEKVAKVALIGGFPSPDGEPYADFFELKDGGMPFPGWGPFEGPDSADLDEEARRSIASAAIPVPEGVAKGVVRLADERRFDVPVVLVCPEFTPTQAQEWIRAGDVPELAKAKHVDFVDIDSGHWPMVSKPIELARLLGRV
jgi:pimeloyl-ACP methyl ester carboxylesterase